MLSETKALIVKAIAREKAFIHSCKTGNQSDNPQVIAMRLKAEGKLEALEAVHYALAGDKVELKIIAGQ